MVTVGLVWVNFCPALWVNYTPAVTNVEEIEIEMPEFIRTFTVVKNYIYFGTDRNSLFEYNINTEEMRKIGYTN